MAIIDEILLGWRPIPTDGILVKIILRGGRENKGASRCVGERIKIEQRSRDRIYLTSWNFIVREGSFRNRIGDRLQTTKIPLSHGLSRHRCVKSYPSACSLPLIIEKEKQFILDHWSAHRAAKLILF